MLSYSEIRVCKFKGINILAFSSLEAQITALVSTQMNMLEALWPVLKLGGKLLYCTCSLFKEESDEQIAHFINLYNDVKLLPIKENWGVYSTYGRQTIPGRDEADGFFYSILEKT